MVGDNLGAMVGAMVNAMVGAMSVADVYALLFVMVGGLPQGTHHALMWPTLRCTLGRGMVNLVPYPRPWRAQPYAVPGSMV